MKNQDNKSNSTNRKNVHQKNKSSGEVLMNDIDQQKKEEIREVFNLFDTDKKKVILGVNMKICLKTLGIEIKKKELIPLLNEMFKKGINDKYKFEEFYQIAKKKMDEKDPKQEIEEQFYLLCNYKENDKRDKEKLTLTKESLTELSKEIGETLSQDEIDEMINIVGGESGIITKDNFISFMRNPLQYNID